VHRTNYVETLLLGDEWKKINGALDLGPPRTGPVEPQQSNGINQWLADVACFGGAPDSSMPPDS
jgi:hypothetical protein